MTSQPRREAAPHFSPERVTRVRFDYDAEFDIASFFLEGPQPGVTDEVDDGWYLRIDEATNTVIGIELHGLQQYFVTDPCHMDAFPAALAEAERAATERSEHGSYTVEGTAQTLPNISHLIIYLIGVAKEKWDRQQRDHQGNAVAQTGS